MKKLVVILTIFLSFLLCACSADTSGFANELTSKSWGTQLDGGAQAELFFADDIATFNLKINNTSAAIKGRYIVDDKTFVIFVPEIAQNYLFEYTPMGKTLKLKYNGHSITMKQKS